MTALYWLRDPGHAWLAVPLADYPDVLDLPEFQPTSETHHGRPLHYYGPVVLDTDTGRIAFLEEDDEARAFFAHHDVPKPIAVVDIPSFDDFAAQHGQIGRRVEV